MKTKGSGGAVGGGGGATGGGGGGGGGGTTQEREANSAEADLASAERCARRDKTAAASAVSVDAGRLAPERSPAGCVTAALVSSEDCPSIENSSTAAPMAPKISTRRGVRSVLMIRCARKC